MYCHQCGKEIEAGDKFCAFCGTAVPDEPIDIPAQSDADTKPLPHADDASGVVEQGDDSETSEGNEAPNDAEPPADAVTQADADTEPIAVEARTNADGETVGETAQVEPDNVAESTADTAASSLKAAVASTRKRSRRKMPMILLVALALALTAAVALAAYFVYTQFNQPTEQTQEVVEEENPQWDEAIDAYQVIIDQYNEALSTYGTYETNSEEIAEQYPYVNFEPMLTASPEDAPWQYAFHDLNDDGVPEMFVGTIGGGRLADNIVYDIWTYQDDEIVSVVQGIFRQNYSLRENNFIMTYGNGGAEVNSYSVLKPTDASFTDFLDPNTDSQDNFTVVESVTSDWGSTDDTLSYEATNTDGTTESGSCTNEEFSSMVDELIAKYPEDTSIEWILFSTGESSDTADDTSVESDVADSGSDDQSTTSSASSDTSSSSSSSATAKTTNARYTPTVDAYNDVINQYKETLKTAPGKKAADDYPLVNPSYLDLSSGSAKQIYFTEYDLNEDGTPELLVGDDMGYDRYGAIEIFDIWTYQGNELVQVAQGDRHHTYSVRTNNLVSIQGQDGTISNGFSVGEPTSSAFTEWTDDASSDDENFIPVETLELKDSAFYDPGFGYIHTTPDGTTTSEECTGSEFSNMIDDLTAKYPEDTSIEWYSMSAA